MRVRLDPSVTYGHLLQTVVIVVGLMGAWFNMRNDLNNTYDKAKAHDNQIRALQQADFKMIENQTALRENLQVLTAIVEERTGAKTPHHP